MYEWIKGNAYNLNVTLYSTNITLNSSAAVYFDEVRWVMIGIDSIHKKIAIKPVPKMKLDSGLIPLENLHKISIGKGYGRISNKSIMNDISEIYGSELEGLKFNATFNDEEQILEVDLNNQI